MKTSPWGRPDFEEKIAEGITVCSTPSHGGYHLSPDRNAQVNEAWKQVGESFGWNRAEGWYEEDVDWAIVAITFPECFPQEAGEEARNVLQSYYPRQYREATRKNVASSE